MNNTSNQMFEVTNLSKHYKNIKAIDELSLRAEKGKIFALLGPNGAGKTTLIRMLSTLVTPDKGTISILGIDAIKYPAAVREIIGLAGQYAAVDEFQTGYENIYMTGRLYHLTAKETKKRTEALLERLGLMEAANRIVRTYSGGMRRRLDLGASLIGQPKVLFLDEPTTGLDPRTRLELWKIIRDLVKAGASILLTTQYLEEADELADRMAVMNNGKIIAEGTSDELKKKLGGDVVMLEVEEKKDVDKALNVLKNLSEKPPTVKDCETCLTIPVNNSAQSLAAIIEAMNLANIRIKEVSLRRPTLDDVFLALTTSDNSVD